MSYIHDALKVSSQKRAAQQNGGSGGPDSKPVHIQKKLSWRYGVPVLLMVALGSWFWASGSPAPEVVSGAQEMKAKSSVQTTSLSAADPSRLKGVEIQVQGTPIPTRSTDVVSNVVPPEQTLSSTDAQGQEVTITKPSASVESANPYDGLPYLRQLPAAQQRELQGLDFSVHIYSEEPASRMVKLNGRVVRELEFIRPGLRVVEIIPRAVVLQYQDRRFKVPAL